MNGKHLLDTNIIIALFKNDENVCKQLASSAETFVPSIAIGELYYGAQHSGNVDKHMDEVRDFVRVSVILSCDAVTAEAYGQIKNGLKTKGQPLPENDIWIAAIALQHSLAVVTRDQHFKAIDGLVLEEW